MTKQTPLHQSAQNSEKRGLPHRGGHTYTKSKNSLRRNRHHNNNTVIPHQQSKNLQFVSKTCPNNMVVEQAVYKKLDPNIPEQAKRIQSRRRMISYGKNTVGYDEYLKQVPKEKRKPRCMETPSTPDYTLDMPNKRWTGQVRAWRRALHTYDPPDLQTSFTKAAKEATEQQQQQEAMDITTNDQTKKSVQELQMEQAKAAGLPVQFSSTSQQNPSPTSVVEASNDDTATFDELDQWEDHNTNDLDDFLSQGGEISDDSDDDLL